MATTSESLAFDRGVRPMLEIVLPEKVEAVIRFRADPELQARVEELAQKSTEGELTEDERAEYAGYVRANKFVAILKRQAQQIRKAPHLTAAVRDPNKDLLGYLEQKDLLRHLEQKLKSSDYEVLSLMREGCPDLEIAASCGITLAQVRLAKARLTYAVRKLLAKPTSQREVNRRKSPSSRITKRNKGLTRRPQ